MSTFVFTDAFVSIDGNDVSDHCTSVTLNYSADEADDTNFADDTHLMIGGLKNWSVDFEFSQDFATSNIDSILFPLVGTTSTIIVRPTASSVSTANPNYTGSALLSTYNPFSGNVGDKATASAHFAAAGTLTRVTS